jgi:hypothetical protein
MGIKDAIIKLKSNFDLPLLITEELHQVVSVQGYKRKKLTDLLNVFGRLRYKIELTFPLLHPAYWKLHMAGRLQSHVELPATIQMRLVPVGPDLNSSINSKLSVDEAIAAGATFMNRHASNLFIKLPDDHRAICEFLGRLVQHYDEFKLWEWFICAKSGTSLNLHLQPLGTFNPTMFVTAMKDCSLARINSIVIYPYTIEIIFRAFSKIEYLPYNRAHRVKFQPY